MRDVERLDQGRALLPAEEVARDAAEDFVERDADGGDEDHAEEHDVGAEVFLRGHDDGADAAGHRANDVFGTDRGEPRVDERQLERGDDCG